MSFQEPDQRSVGQRDRDRLLYTDELRRLAEITQVVSPNGYAFHNRLTHTLEVAQVARRLAEKLKATCVAEKRLEWAERIDPDIVEAAALIHDMGHPPFGHVGEEELDALAIEAGNLDGFEGNAQSFRIVTRLAVHSPNYNHLNLTRETLNASLKYPNLRGEAPAQDAVLEPEERKRQEKAHRKFGAYRDDLASFEFARAGSPDAQPSLEAQIMDHADDIAYSIHDLTDFYKAGLLPLVAVRAQFNSFFQENKSHFLPHGYDEVEAEEHLRGAIIDFPDEYRGTRTDQQYLRGIASRTISSYINVGIDWTGPYPRLEIDPRHDLEIKFFKRLIWVYVILRSQLAAQQYGQREIIRFLFKAFRETIEHALATSKPEDCRMIPPRFLAALDDLKAVQNTTERQMGAIRLTVDIIASLSDIQAKSLSLRMRGIEGGQLTDSMGL